MRKMKQKSKIEELFSFKPPQMISTTDPNTSRYTISDILLKYQPQPKNVQDIFSLSPSPSGTIYSNTVLGAIDTVRDKKIQTSKNNYKPEHPSNSIQDTPLDMFEMFKAGYNTAAESEQISSDNHSNYDPITLFQLIKKIVQPVVEDVNKVIDRNIEMIKIMHRDNPSYKDVFELVKFMKEYFIDEKRRTEIEIAKIKFDSDIKYHELRLQLLKMKMKQQQNMAKMDVIIALLTSALQILSPFLESLQSTYSKQPRSQLSESEKMKVKTKPIPDENVLVSSAYTITTQ